MKSFSSISEIVSLSRSDFERTCIEFAANAYMGDHIQLCKVLSKYKLYVDTRDTGIAPHLISDGFWESWITRYVAAVVRPGYTCLDVGANFGYYSVLMSELTGKKGRTIAIEPNPVICQLLRNTAIVNEWSFEVIEAAVSDKRGNAVLSVENKFPGGATIMPLDENLPGRSRYTVSTFTIDELVEEQQLGTVDFMKIDCEGFEPFVFDGMKKTLAANPDLQIVMEYSAYMYTNPVDFTKRLFCDFEVGRINGSSSIDRLSVKDIDELVQFKRPVDLYLKKKK